LGNVEKLLGSVDVGGLGRFQQEPARRRHRARSRRRRCQAIARSFAVLSGWAVSSDNKPELLKFYDAVQVKQDDKNLRSTSICLATDALLKQFRPARSLCRSLTRAVQ
jgi:hypothetical protein